MSEESVELDVADLSGTISALNKKYGKVIIRNAKTEPPVRRVPWDIPAVDFVIGGGVPINRFIEIYGGESSGKSYLSYKAIAKFQHYDWKSNTPDAFEELIYEEKLVKGTKATGGLNYYDFVLKKAILRDKKVKDFKIKKCVLIDYENTYDPNWGEALGINNDNLIRVVPEKGSEAIDVAEAFIMNQEVSLVVIDSVGAIASDMETDESMEKEQMGVNARFWNKAMRKLQSAMNKNPDKDVTVILINRAYQKVGFVLGNPEQIGGGSGIRFAKAVSIRLHALKEQQGDIGGVKQVIGRAINVKCVKNKTSRPFLESSFYHSYVDDGYLKANETDIVNQLIDIGVQNEIIERKGAYYIYGKVSSQGRETFVADLIEGGYVDSLKAKLYKEVIGK